jgi:hypothetical protein
MALRIEDQYRSAEGLVLTLRDQIDRLSRFPNNPDLQDEVAANLSALARHTEVLQRATAIANDIVWRRYRALQPPAAIDTIEQRSIDHAGDALVKHHVLTGRWV